MLYEVITPLGKSGMISRRHIESCAESADADIIFFDTHFSEKRTSPSEYSDDFPALSEDAALFV